MSNFDLDADGFKEYVVDQLNALTRKAAKADALAAACQMNEDVRRLKHCSYTEARAIGERYGFRNAGTLYIESQVRSMAETATRVALASYASNPAEAEV